MIISIEYMLKIKSVGFSKLLELVRKNLDTKKEKNDKKYNCN